MRGSRFTTGSKFANADLEVVDGGESSVGRRRVNLSHQSGVVDMHIQPTVLPSPKKTILLDAPPSPSKLREKRQPE